MNRQKVFVAIGQFLFRFRCYLPLALMIALIGLFWNDLGGLTGWGRYVWRGAALGGTVLGVVLRCVTIGRIPRGTSGRNTKQQKASVLNTTGIYSVVRNPLYLANALIWIGITLLLENLLLMGIFAAVLLGYYTLVVLAEQDFLSTKFGEQYRIYTKTTPALVLHPHKWQPSDRPFSWRTVLRREHDSIFSAVTGLMIVFQCHDIIAHNGQFMLRREWVIPWAVLGIAWMVLKVVKKKTGLLRPDHSNLTT